VLVSGHGPQNSDGSPAGPFGRVPDEVSLEQAQQSARLAALSVIASVEDAVGDLDAVDAWLSVTGFVQAEPGYARTTAVLNSFSEVVLDVFGASVGAHARTAIGVAALPLNLPVVVAAELHLARPGPSAG
jgi:enamine deaminase RidA (YjgF/YER057c/UK114 family)